MTRPGRTLAQVLTRRLILVATVIFALNIAVVGTYYGSDRRGLEAYVVDGITTRLGAALSGGRLPADAPVRAIFADHPAAYGFALIDRSGAVVDAMNRTLIPAFAIDILADDWITRIDRRGGHHLIAGHEFTDRADGLRVVFAMTDDPARLMWRAT